MKYALKDYQETAVSDLLVALERAHDQFGSGGEHQSVCLTAPTGAGKTVIATAVVERLFHGDPENGSLPVEGATVLWVTDDPSLNIQTLRKMYSASSLLHAGPQLLTIDGAFDAELLPSNAVTFLNIQKLRRGSIYEQSGTNRRTWSLWETISNTARRRGGRFVVVIDEAHRGTGNGSDRPTIISRIISGDQDQGRTAAPVVWGITATPERFQRAMSAAQKPSRVQRNVPVDVADVRASGLVKDIIVLHNPHGGPAADTALTVEAVRAVRGYESTWATYAAANDEEAPLPILVVQVKANVTAKDVSDLVNSLRDAWNGLRTDNIAHTFGEWAKVTHGHIPLPSGAGVRYIEPHAIQDDDRIRVVLCKEAITTGWDCPRAEVLLSFRAARDATYIAQLLGRMVRTPMARRIDGDETLNTVAVFLPHFDTAQVEAVASAFHDGAQSEDVGASEAVTALVACGRNSSVPDEVWAVAGGLPTYTRPAQRSRSNIIRLRQLAHLLAYNGIDEDAPSQASRVILGAMATRIEAAKDTGDLEEAVRAATTVRMTSTEHDLTTGRTSVREGSAVRLDPRGVDREYRRAARLWPDHIADEYLADKHKDGADLVAGKSELVALIKDPDALAAVELAAGGRVRELDRKYQRRIDGLPAARRAEFDRLREQSADAEVTQVIFPEGAIAARPSEKGSKDPLHLYVQTTDGLYPQVLNGWEREILDTEIADSSLLGWYRNPTSGSRALRIPYANDPRSAVYPDFVFFHRNPGDDSGVSVSIVDPHSTHLADGVDKLHALATYANKHGQLYTRIESVAKGEDGRLRRLNLCRPEVAAAALDVKQTEDIAALFERLGAL
ncbi:DEAD/DEAH box helicase family protein [Streptomyces prunicolor]|uniref:DEAD/DEAH box helicase family protein n=1 Tax=Streptomyces prunicolor TaxID=67348 RepID=UPI0037CF8117